ncbi:phosphoenolpyruvate--protein phosphotransferase [Sphingomonas ginkgonis]|uniref:phosphoenolpyruvate--protein phosphotransferase n=1 Tax=Sphingomonas ginkgonis TaxID=2315330 RepID=A0A3R9Y4L7_9SPHN|nr:phosphoenolpyruvate--protein phosphotransferase [Sphingomonas ginkgonis]RST30060.1 phosphoenolpyruvate--protein phosphotransferase [Sphingomonas ginkgonis]
MSEVLLVAPFAGWLSALDEVADPVFAERMIGDGLAIDPIEGLLRAPADAEVVSVADSAHAVTLRLANGAELLLHIGLDTVMLGGRGFEARVRPGDRVAAGDPLIRFDLAAIARVARDLVTPLVLPGDGASLALLEPGRMVAAGDEIARVTLLAVEAGPPGTGDAVRRTIPVTAPLGLHARPAARMVALLKPYDATIEVIAGERRANGRSTTALLALGARAGDQLLVEARGPDAAAALEALATFSAERFGDPAGEPPPLAPAPPSGGIGAAPGLAIGPVRQFRPAPVTVPEEGRGIAHESRALAEALAVAAGPAAADGLAGDIREAHRAILADPDLLAAAQAAIGEGKSAGWAWSHAIGAAAAALGATGDARLVERVADLRDIERQMLVALGGSVASLPALGPDTILIAEELLPSQFLALDRGRLAGICTARGGATAHVVLLAAAAGVPMVVNAGPDVLAVADGTVAVLDGAGGTLVTDPDRDQLDAARSRQAQQRERRAAEARAAMAPATTADGTRIEVFANLGSLEDADAAVQAGAEGCGLLRTEFLFLDRASAPDEAEQRSLYAGIAERLGGRPLIVRTMDIGGDKPVPYLPFPSEENPALGQRGLRLSLARPELFAVQLRAILAAVPGEQCRILLPMVSELAELRRARAAIAAAMAEVRRTSPVQVGVMIETPAAALLAEPLAAEADFMSIGTNDLTQYTLAADRGNAAVAGLVDPLHPAVLRLIAHAAEGAARHRRPLGLCGGLASEPGAAALLVGLGVTELSATPAAVPAVKAVVRTIRTTDAKALADRAREATSTAEVRALLEDPR